MCGLVGVAGTLEGKHERAFETLLALDTFRGVHSTGLFRVKRYLNEEVDLLKEVGTPWEGLFRLKEYKGFYTPWSKILAGHNRAATIGEVTKENAHPFQIGKIVGMHNGTLRDQSLLDDHKDFEVDSENIIHCIDKIGAEETIAKLHGAYALVWYNMEEKQLNFIRNHERPLKYVFSEDGKALFWASEEWMLTGALARCGIKSGEIMDFTPMVHYKLPILQHYNQGKPYTDNLLGKVITKELKPYIPPKRDYKDYYRGSYYDDNDSGVYEYGHRRSLLAPQPRRKWDPIGGKWTPNEKKDEGFPILPRRAPDFKDYQFADNKFVFFRVVSTVSGSPGGSYIRGVTTDRCIGIMAGLEVRLYLAHNSHDWRTFGISNLLLRGKVKAAKNIEGGYLLLDRRSVRELIDAKKEEEVLIPEDDGGTPEDDVPFEPGDSDGDDAIDEMFKVGKAGYFANLGDFKRLVKDGCAECSDPIFPEDCEDLIWIYDDRPMCLRCQKEQWEAAANETERRTAPTKPVQH